MWRKPQAMRLMSERIPESCTEVIELRAARVAFFDEVGALDGIDREAQALRHHAEAEFEAGAVFVKVHPNTDVSGRW